MRMHAAMHGMRSASLWTSPSHPTVEESLTIAIRMYLDRASELPEEERSGFLTRRAPWRMRFGLAAQARLAAARSAP